MNLKINSTDRVLDEIVVIIKRLDPLHAKKIVKNINSFDEEYFKRVHLFFEKYVELLESLNHDLEYGVTCYLKMIADVNYEQLRFMESGEYSSKSFEEVNKRVYGNPEIMEYYMHGLLLSQFLWSHHYKILTYFADSLPRFSGSVSSYLEIGAGHGLYISEAIKKLDKDVEFSVVDISPTSIDLAKKFVGDERVKYTLCDIFKWDVPRQFDFITMGEVLEHVEEPEKLLKRIRSLLTDKGHAFITTPTNAAAIDHIALFRNADEIRDIIGKAGFTIVDELGVYSEDIDPKKAEALKVSLMYAAFIIPK